MTKINCVALVVLSAATVLANPDSASAFASVNIGTGSADHIFVGITQRPSGSTCDATYAACPSPGVTANFACMRGTSTSSAATWYALGSGAGIVDDFEIEGNGGNDYIYFWRAAGNQGAGDTCRGNTNWNDATLNGHYLDADGGSGSDSILSGDNDTWIKGGADGDTLSMYDNGQAAGEGGADTIEGFTTGEDLVGGDQNDCIADSGSFFSATGGSGTNEWDGPAPCPDASFTIRITDGQCGAIIDQEDC